MSTGWRVHRPLIMGRNGAVASNHPLATQAGLDILRAGGSAVDAAVAISLTLGVVESHMSGLGGDGFYNVWSERSGQSEVFEGTGPAPASARAEAFAAGGIPPHGPLSVSVPGKLAGLHAMHAAHGTMPWADLCQPAIRFAADGFAATHVYRHFANLGLERLGADPTSSRVFLAAGKVPDLAAIILQPALAETLRRIAEGGAETFYRGDLARDLVGDMKAAGVPITAADMAAIEGQAKRPISITYRGFEIRQTPPGSMGFVLLQELKIVEHFDLGKLGPDSAELLHLLVEAKKRAFLDRERHAADPLTRDIPLSEILSDAYAAKLARGIDPARAADIPLRHGAPNEGDTTYFCVADGEGNAVSAIQSINGAFGSGVTLARTGVLLNNRMTYWHLDPTHPNVLVPGKRVRHTMNAPMVFRDGRPWALLGTPGADNQVQVNLQAIVRLIDFGLDPQQVAEAPRWSSEQQGQDANWPHAGRDALTLEEGFPAATYIGLKDRGHTLLTLPPHEGPCSLACIRILPNGVRMAGSDPRRDGWAGAF